ncbi:MAG TPA: hypothetical protein VG963_11510, partial [Polyangiaceae bacterium]|nr:hypothetical protein [Polyangiaceae bacterium]
PLQFADSVELVFRVSPNIRANEIAAYCIGGPAHSPHVAVQLRLGPGEGRVLPLALSPGRHRVRSPELPHVLELDVSPEHPFARADLVIGARLRALRSGDAEDARLAPRPSEPAVRLMSGQQTLGLRNDLGQEVTIRIERSASREDALTAARAWALPKFRELFPGETLESGRLVAVGQMTFLVLYVLDHLGLIERQGDALALAETLRVFDLLQQQVEKRHGRFTSSSLDHAIAAFERSEDAIDAALALVPGLSDPELVAAGLGIHRGPAVATSIDDRMTYYGQTLARSIELAHEAAPRSASISFAALGDQLARLTTTQGLSATVLPAPLLGPAAWRVELAAEADARSATRELGARTTLSRGLAGTAS